MKARLPVFLVLLGLIALARIRPAGLQALPRPVASYALTATPKEMYLPLAARAWVGPNTSPSATQTPSSTPTPQPAVSAEALFVLADWDATDGWHVWVAGVITNTFSTAIEVDTVACQLQDAGGREVGLLELEACMPVVGASSSAKLAGGAVFDVPQDRRPTTASIVPSWHPSDKRRSDLPTEHWFTTIYLYDAPVTVLHVRVSNPHTRRISGELEFASETDVGCGPTRFTLEPGESCVGLTHLNRPNSTNEYYRYWAVYDPDQVLPTSTPSVTPVPSVTPTPTPEGCLTSRDSFQSAPFSTQAGAFTAEFDVRLPDAVCESGLNAVLGLSEAQATTHSHLGPIVGISAPLEAVHSCVQQYGCSVVARDADEYRADNAIPADYGKLIHFRMVVSVPAHSYSVYACAPGKPEIAIASDYAFRTEQSGVTSLGYWNVWSGASSVVACAFQVTP